MSRLVGRVLCACGIFAATAICFYFWEAWKARTCADNVVTQMASIHLALFRFNDLQHRMPPPIWRRGTENECSRDPTGSGDELFSWRFAILPELGFGGSDAVGQNFPCFTSRWDSGRNARFRSMMPSEFCLSGHVDGRTNVLAVTGSNSAFDPKFAEANAVFEPDLIILVEACASSLHWMEPGDIDASSLDTDHARSAGIDRAGICGNGMHLLFWDGAVWQIRRDTPFDAIRVLCTNTGARANDRNQVLGKFRIR